MHSTYYHEFGDFCNSVIQYSEDCAYNYNECVNIIISDAADLDFEERLQYLNEQAEEKNNKGFFAIVQKFSEFIQKIVAKIKEAFNNLRIATATKVINEDEELRKLRVTAPDPKKFDRFIKMRYKATDNVIKRIKRKKMCVTKNEFDDMIDQEFGKLYASRTSIIGGAIAMGITAVLTYATYIVSKKVIQVHADQYEKEITDACNSFSETENNIKNMIKHAKNREEADNLVKKYAENQQYAYQYAENIKLRKDVTERNDKVNTIALYKKVLGGGFMASSAIAAALLNKVAETASYQEQYLQQAFKIINRAALQKSGSVNIVNNKKIYNFTNK